MSTPDTFVDRVVNEISALKSLWGRNKLVFTIVCIVGAVVLFLAVKPHIDIFKEGEGRTSDSTTSDFITSAASEQPQNAKEALHMGQYLNARNMFKDMLLRGPDEATADEIRGMVTATYYGEGLHQEGLEYICEQYNFKTADSRAFLFGVHAHTRALSVSGGADMAVQIAAKMRKKCRRPDFSEFWAYIPFGMMESLRIGTPRSLHNWSLSKEEKNKLSLWLENKHRKEANRSIYFSDFVLYFLDRFDEVLANYPKSSIREIAMFDAAAFSVSPEKKIYYYKKFISEFPRSRHFESVVSALATTLESIGRRSEALMYVAKIRDAQFADWTVYYRVTEPALRKVSGFIRVGELRSAIKLVNAVCNDYKSNKIKCPGELEEKKKAALLAIDYSKSKRKNLTCSRTQLEIRNLADRAGYVRDIDWRYAARSYLANCIEHINNDSEDYARSLYLVASLSRKVNDYKTSIEYLRRFRREVKDHELMDDVICEIGYHQMFIERNWEEAKKSFIEVINKYPKRNAYDNALWWYGIGSKNVGNFAQAIPAFVKIGSLEAQSRFKQWGNGEQEKLKSLVSQEPFQGITVQADASGGDGLIILSVKPPSPFIGSILKGDRLLKVCGETVFDVDVLLELNGKTNIAFCEIEFFRAGYLLRFTKTRGGVWEVDKSKYIKQQPT